MTIGQASNSDSTGWFLSPKSQLNPLKRPKVHDYTLYERGLDYVIEPMNEGSQTYMTAQGKGVRCGDYIILKNAVETERYRVEKVDYYASPSDIWVALLTQVKP